MNPQIQNVKCKGICLNYSTSNQINFEYMLKLVTEPSKWGDKCYVNYLNHMKRDKKRMRIDKVHLVKSFGFTFDKCKIIEHVFLTELYGYIK